MVWKFIFRTIQSIFGIVGFVMGCIGIYFDTIQASQTPIGPFGLNILTWGFILFVMASLSVIAQLWWHIHKTEESYLYALSLDGLHFNASFSDMQIVLELSSSLDKPLRYKVDLNNYYLEIDGNRQPQTDSGLFGSTISGRKPSIFQLPRFASPEIYPCNILVHYEILYGSPQKIMFRQIRDLSLDVVYGIGESLPKIANWVILKEQDKPIKK